MILLSQNDQDGEVTINLDEIENDGKRIEIQRYFGYERLLSRYLTLPYDISANTSNQGRFFDIGFVLFSIFPISLLCFFYKRKKVFYGVMCLFILYLGLSFHHSYINVGQNSPVHYNSTNWDIQTNAGQFSSSQEALISIYNALGVITQPLHILIKAISDESDHVTYGILFMSFIGILLLLWRSSRKSVQMSVLSCIIFSFCYLWLLLSGGIIWYGFLMLPLLFMLALANFQPEKRTFYSFKRPIKYLAFAAIFLWVCIAFVARVSNIQSYNIAKEHLGKEIVNSQLILYSTGIHDRKESRDLLYRNIGSTFEEINSSNSLIYQVGTSMTFEIEKNTERVFQDNTLIDFFKILNKYRNKEVIIDVLKASGYEYIIVDLFTHTLDKTPEQSLVKKFQLFLNTLYENPKIRLLATDRVVQQNYSDGSIEFINDVFGSSDPDAKVQVKDFGSYAIYKII